MIYRKANIPVINANNIYSTVNLPEKIKEILISRKYIYKILKFCKPEIIERWELNKNWENAEMIAKYIVRLATRTTINQLFGVLVTDTVKEGELFLLAPEFYQELKKKIMFENLDREDIVFKISNQLERKKSYYVSCHCYGGIRKDFVLRKETLIGDLAEFIEKKHFVSGREILNFGKEMNVPKETMIRVVNTLYQLECLHSNINIELFDYDAYREGKFFSKFLEWRDIEYLKKILQGIEKLNYSNDNDFFKIKAEIEEYAGLILGRKSDRRIVNGYSREYCQETKKDDFRMSKLLKRFFTCLGMNAPEYIEMQQFVEKFVDKYGLFCCVPVQEALKLYRQIVFERNEIYEQQKEFVMSKIRKAELNKREVVDLSAEDLEEICTLGDSDRGLRSFSLEFDLKYQCYHQNIVMSEMTFAYAGAFCNAYLKAGENGAIKENREVRYIDCCPEYLPSVGMPMGLIKENKFKIDSWEERQTDLNDLGIMADFEGIHVVDKKTGVKFIPINATMISFMHQTENIYAEFLDKLGKYIVKMPSTTVLIPQEDMIFIPRICYKNFILQRKTWILNYKGIETEFDLDEELKRRKVDRYVFLKDRENIYLDLNSDLGKKWLKEHIKKNKSAILSEVLLDEEVVTERITRVEFLRDDFREYKGQFWLLYGENGDGIGKYTSWHLVYNTVNLSALKEILFHYFMQYDICFFYIHYIENGQKVLRIRTRNLEYQNGRRIMEHLIEDGLIIDYSIQRYQPEITRYGGSQYIDKFEMLFEEESRITLNKEVPEKSSEILMLQVALILAFCENLMDTENILCFLYKFFGSKEKETILYYKKYRKDLSLEVIHKNALFFKQKFASIDKRIKEYISEIAKGYSQEYSEYILLSLIHMRINRISAVTDQIEVESKHVAFIAAKKIFNKNRFDIVKMKKDRRKQL